MQFNELGISILYKKKKNIYIYRLNIISLINCLQLDACYEPNILDEFLLSRVH